MNEFYHDYSGNCDFEKDFNSRKKVPIGGKVIGEVDLGHGFYAEIVRQEWAPGIAEQDAVVLCHREHRERIFAFALVVSDMEPGKDTYLRNLVWMKFATDFAGLKEAYGRRYCHGKGGLDVGNKKNKLPMAGAYKVGDVCPYAVYRPDSCLFDMDDCGITLHVFMCRPAPHEVEQFASGKPFEMRLAQLRNVVFALFKFGSLEWMDAPYSVHLSRNLTRLESPADGCGFAMNVHVYDTRTGRLLHNRLLSLSTEISRGLVKLATEQKEKPFDWQEHENTVRDIYAAYPTKRLLPMALYSYRLR